MTECNRKNRLLGKSIRKIRMRRNMTQRELANAIDGISEPALRSYELGERCPKQNTLERIAKALDVAPACFDAYGIEHYHELMHVLFLLEDRFGIEPCGKHPERNLCQVFKEIDFVFADDGNPRWRHLGFLVSGQAGNPAEKAWERVRRHPLFHAFSALALIEYQCSPAKAALRVARFGKRIYKVT